MYSSGGCFSPTPRNWTWLEHQDDPDFYSYKVESNCLWASNGYGITPVYVTLYDDHDTAGVDLNNLELLLKNMMLSLRQSNPAVLKNFIQKNRDLMDLKFWELDNE